MGLLAALLVLGAACSDPKAETSSAPTGTGGSAGSMPGAGGDWTTRDECEDGSHACDANAICADTAEFYTCTCKDGFAGEGSSCKDIDECAVGTHDCDGNAICTNQEPGFSCECQAGLTGDGKNCRSQYEQVASGAEFSCALRTEGSVW